MSLTTKILTGTAAGALAIAGWSYANNLKRAAAELEVVPKASIYQQSWDGLTVRVDILLKNPTKGSFSLKFPFVKLLYKDTTIGSSQAVNKEIKIPSYGEVVIDKMMVQIPITSVFSVVFNLVKALNNKEAIKLVVRIATAIDLGWIVLPYEKAEEVTIKK